MRKKSFLNISVPLNLSTSTPSVHCPVSCSVHSHIPSIDLVTATISSLARDLSNCRYSSTDLVRWYLMRIEAVNRRGPHPLYAIIETNPDALTIANMLDRERQTNGSRSSLHGIPILVKDNVATNDKMQTTAGSLALVGARVARDAHIVDRLRQAGAIILGKTSLSEWSNFRSTNRSREGWSPRGGPSRYIFCSFNRHFVLRQSIAQPMLPMAIHLEVVVVQLLRLVLVYVQVQLEQKQLVVLYRQLM